MFQLSKLPFYFEVVTTTKQFLVSSSITEEFLARRRKKSCAVKAADLFVSMYVVTTSAVLVSTLAYLTRTGGVHCV